MIEIPPGITGLVFDCDGTIADTMPLHYKAWLIALGEHKVEFPEAMFYQFAGMPTSQIIEVLNQRHGHHMPVMETTIKKEKLFEELIPEILPIEPIVKLIKECHGRLPMAVATGGTRAICTRTLEVMGILDHFNALVTADDKVKPKPSPDIFLEAARKIGIPAKQCMAFEDADLGVRSARDAGMVVYDVRVMKIV